MKNLSKLYFNFLKENKELKDVLEVVSLNNKGKAWLIGGFVFRNLSDIIYSSKKKYESDIDILISDSPKTFQTIKRWSIKKNRFGNPKFIKGHRTIDLVPIQTVSQIIRMRLKPSINNYLKYVPFNIQSIAYDLNNKKLLGKMGKDALLSKKIVINDAEQAKIYLDKKGLSSEEWINKKNKELGFNRV